MTAASAAAGNAPFDCIVIGGGHNGLVCATLLARRGRKVLVLEAESKLGGAATTREFAPGYRVSACAHLLHLLPASLIAELALERHGLVWAAQDLPTTALVPGEAPLPLEPQALGADAAAYGRFGAQMQRFARALAPVLEQAPPRLGTRDFADVAALLRLGLRIRRLGRADMRELLRIGGMNVHDLLEEHFDSSVLRGALGFDAVLGTNFGPRSPGTVLTLLYRLAGEAAAGARGFTQPRGGLGALSEALAQAARAAGVTLRTDAPVARVLVEADRASGVELESGERIGARCVVSNADPKTTFLRLIGPRYLDTGFVRRVHHLRARGLAAKLHLALDRAPSFGGLATRALGGRLVLAPSLEYLERAFNHAKYGEYSAAPALEITVPTYNDPTLAPEGRHVLSAIVQYAPYELKGGWQGERERFKGRLVELLERLSPGLSASIVASELLTPVDLEREFRMSGGHWHHADLAFDQFYFVRPVPGAAQHRSPLPGLYLCGAGCHPGGGVMGHPGRNAARRILEASP